MSGMNIGNLARRVTIVGRGTWTAGWMAALLVLVAWPLTARAQVENVATPFYVTVEHDDVPLQCRMGSASYPVKMLKSGQVLKVDGQSQSMYRVEYPAGMNAFVKLDEVTLGDGGKSATLTKPSRLMAPNSEGGVSWWYLLDKELDAGTALKVEKTVKGPDGKDSGYLVPAPVGSKGYIRRDYVRQATQGEVDKFLGKGTAAPGDQKPGEAVKPSESTPPSAAPKPTDGTAAKPAETTPGVATINVKPATATPPEGEKPAAATPAGAKPIEGATPAADGTKPATAPKAMPELKPIIDADTLNKLYSDGLKTTDEGEIQAVMAEFQRTIDSLPQSGAERLRKQLSDRVRVLKMRESLQAALRQSTQSSEALRQQSAQMNAELERLEKQRRYTVVGRLVASAVYDGRQLPLMYRLLSPEPGSARTLAYIAPDAKSDLADKVGRIVGVAGDTRFDESLRLNIVAPTRIDILGAIEVPPLPLPNVSPGPATAPPATPEKAPASPAPDENK